MTELAVSTTRVISCPEPRLNTEISDAVQTYAGGYAGLRGPGHATSQGYLDAFNDEAGMIPLGGFFSDEVLGDTTGLPLVNPVNNVDVRTKVLRRHAVTGTSSRGDIGKHVYLSDDNVMTLTRPTTYGFPIGMVWEWHVSTTCDVLLYGLDVLNAIALAGGGETDFYVGGIDFSTFANGDVVTSLPLVGHGLIVRVYTITEVTLVGSGGTGLINLEIGTTNLTGGVVTVATATQGTMGTLSDGTAVTGNNRFHDGDALSVELSSVSGTTTSGRVGLHIVIQWELGV